MKMNPRLYRLGTAVTFACTFASPSYAATPAATAATPPTATSAPTSRNIHGAITDALGIREIEMPATPERVWRAANRKA